MSKEQAAENAGSLLASTIVEKFCNKSVRVRRWQGVDGNHTTRCRNLATLV